GEWKRTARMGGGVVEAVDGRALLGEIAEAAWRSADPGVQYDTTINSWHTLPNTGRINASNPCSEYMSIDDSACNLASLNLLKFRREDGELDVEAFEHAVDVVFLAQEIAVGYSSYPTPEIERNAKAYRQLGLGYANLGALLMARGLPYAGSVSCMMDCDRTAVEPDFSLVKSKKLVGGGEITIPNKTVPMALEKLGYAPREVEEIVAFVDERNTVIGAPNVKAEHYPVFDCAIGERAIHYTGHVKMMGATQPFISGAISKTVNLPETVSV